MFRQTLLRQTRLFSTSVRMNKGPIEAVKDTVKSADKAVSQKIVQGIEATGKFSSSFYLHSLRHSAAIGGLGIVDG
jgi:hypothetical protein